MTFPVGFNRRCGLDAAATGTATSPALSCMSDGCQPVTISAASGIRWKVPPPPAPMRWSPYMGAVGGDPMEPESAPSDRQRRGELSGLAWTLNRCLEICQEFRCHRLICMCSLELTCTSFVNMVEKTVCFAVLNRLCFRSQSIFAKICPCSYFLCASVSIACV